MEKDEKENAFIFNGINIYDLFVYSVYPNYYKSINVGKKDKGIIDGVIKKSVDAVLAEKENTKITDEMFVTFLQTWGKDNVLDSPDKINVEIIMDNLGATKTLNMMRKAMSSSLKVGEEEKGEWGKALKENKGIKNKMNSEKYNTLYKFNIRLAVFILSLIHDLYWDKFTVNEEIGNVENIKSGFTLNECFQEIIPVAKNLMNVFNDMLDVKYPTSLTLSSLNYEFKKEKLEAETVINDNIKIGKTKK